MEALIEKYFGEWSSSSIYLPQYKDDVISNGFKVSNKDIEQVHISLGIKGLPFSHPQGYALLLLGNIFGGGASSVLFQKIREERGLVYAIDSHLSTYDNTGNFTIYAGLS